MAKTNTAGITGPIDCACVIHGTAYDWQYVERLYNMLRRNISQDIHFHVYTEPDRTVPDYMIKHELDLWPGIAGPKRSWWYKLQLFNPAHHAGNLLYFDLDIVIVNSLDWIFACDPAKFWAIRDFKYLQRPQISTINSSVMWWNVFKYAYVWQQFADSNIEQVTRRFPGDQDYLARAIERKDQQFFKDRFFQSYRWQCLDGGYNFRTRKCAAPGTGVQISPDTAAIIFHGQPKPDQIKDPVIQDFWR